LERKFFAELEKIGFEETSDDTLTFRNAKWTVNLIYDGRQIEEVEWDPT
jgi:hypothetical protein